MTSAEVRTQVLEAESLLFKRLDATSDPAERRSLADQLEALNRQKDRLTLSDAIHEAEELNALTDVLVAALAGVRTQPLNGIAGQIEGLISRIGGSVGDGPVRADDLGDGQADAAPIQPAPKPGRKPAARPAAGGTGPAIAIAAGSDGSAIAKEYLSLFGDCVVRPEQATVVGQLAARVIESAAQYQKAAEAAGGSIPWYFIGIIHGMEASFSFDKHLHNGDPLDARTVKKPAGLPLSGAPRFTWLESAVDALRLKGLERATDWSIPAMLGRWEAFNGFGYRSRGLNTPYLWSFSNQYEKGKFVRDGVFDPEFVSGQCGAAVILKQLVEQGAVTQDPRSGATSAAAALGGGAVAVQPGAALPAPVRAEVEFPGEIGPGARKGAAVKRVQEWCSFHGPATRIDEDFGSGTADAVRGFQADAGIPVSGTVDARTWAALTLPMLRALGATTADRPGLAAMVVAVARQHLAQRPVEVGGDNAGPWVRLYMAGRDGIEQQWCAGFACFVVAQAARALGQEMPFKRQVGCDALVADARRDGRFIAGDELRTADARLSRLPPGSLFAIRDAANPADYFHAGLVVGPGAESFRTVEGNTNQDGGSRGFEVTTNSRAYRNTDFILLA